MFVLLFRLVWTITCHLWIEKEEKIFVWERFNQTFNNSMLWTNIYQLRTKWRKIKTPNTFCWTQSQYFHAEIWKISLENMEDKILGLQFEHVSAKPTRPSYNDGSGLDEPQQQPPEVFCKKRCLYKFRKIHRKTPVPESLFQ